VKSVTLSFDWHISATLLLKHKFCDLFGDIYGDRLDVSSIDVEADEEDASSIDYGRHDATPNRKFWSIQRDSGSRTKCLPMICGKRLLRVLLMKD
jgi:hypothetical protein